MVNKDFLRLYTDPSLGHFAMDDAPEAWLNHPKSVVTSEHIEHIMNTGGLFDVMAAVRHPSATEEQITKGLNDHRSPVRREAAKNPNATKEHLINAYSDESHDGYGNMSVRNAAIANPNFLKYFPTGMPS